MRAYFIAFSHKSKEPIFIFILLFNHLTIGKINKHTVALNYIYSQLLKVVKFGFGYYYGRLVPEVEIVQTGRWST